MQWKFCTLWLINYEPFLKSWRIIWAVIVAKTAAISWAIIFGTSNRNDNTSFIVIENVTAGFAWTLLIKMATRSVWRYRADGTRDIKSHPGSWLAQKSTLLLLSPYYTPEHSKFQRATHHVFEDFDWFKQYIDGTKLELLKSKSRTYHHRHRKFWVKQAAPMLEE